MDCRPQCETILETEPRRWEITHDRTDEALNRAQGIEDDHIILTEVTPQLDIDCDEASIMAMVKRTLQYNLNDNEHPRIEYLLFTANGILRLFDFCPVVTKSSLLRVANGFGSDFLDMT